MSPSIASAYLARSWSSCHAALFPDPTMPPRSWERDVAGFLFERGYHPDSIRLVLDHAGRWGTVECSPELVFCEYDRQHVEAKLPEAPIGTWLRVEFSGVWTA